MSKNKKIKEQQIKDTKNGMLTTTKVIAGVVVTLAIGSILGKTKNVNLILTQKPTVSTEIDNNNKKISFTETPEYKVIKIIGDGYKFKEYQIVKESDLPYRENDKIKKGYSLVNIYNDNEVLYKDENQEILPDDSSDTYISYTELGNLTDYLIEYDYVKEQYDESEFKMILEKLKQNNKNKDNIDFKDTSRLNIIEIENNNNYSYHVVKYIPDPVCHNFDVSFNSLCRDILTEEYVLGVDEFDEVTDEYKNYSYKILGSLSDYLITYNLIQPEYNKKEIKNVIERVKKEEGKTKEKSK